MFVATETEKHGKTSIYFWTEEVYLSSLTQIQTKNKYARIIKGIIASFHKNRTL